jgi:hypothetical protein
VFFHHHHHHHHHSLFQTCPSRMSQRYCYICMIWYDKKKKRVSFAISVIFFFLIYKLSIS